jgi:tRNA threonylcarbamoyladenosine biosynthesis protein TsaE
MTEFVTKSTDETIALGERIGALLQEGDVLVLRGDLGAGKTQLTKGIAAGMGVTDDVTSPTFTIQMVYEGTELPLYHFDLYRLSDPDEYWAAGLDEFVGGDGVALVEWPQMAELDVAPALNITLTRGAEDDARRIEIENDGVAGFDPAALSDWRDADGV